MTESICTGWNAVTHTTARVSRGTVAGFLGGIIASWVMTQYRTADQGRGAEATEAGAKPARRRTAKDAGSNGDAATVKVAEAVSRKLFEHDLSGTEKKIAGPTVHYGYGALVGAVYGGLAELVPSVSAGLGVPYATMLWLGGDEIAVPSLGLAKPPVQVPAEDHATALATHFVYGITLDISRRILRRIL